MEEEEDDESDHENDQEEVNAEPEPNVTHIFFSVLILSQKEESKQKSSTPCTVECKKKEEEKSPVKSVKSAPPKLAKQPETPNKGIFTGKWLRGITEICVEQESGSAEKPSKPSPEAVVKETKAPENVRKLVTKITSRSELNKLNLEQNNRKGAC
jgi:hypothetical protein